MKRIAIFSALTVATALALPPLASAHGLVNRRDLPLPAWLFTWAAAVVLIASFLALSALWAKPRLQSPHLRSVGRVPGIVDGLCGAIGVVVFAFVVYAGLAGDQFSTLNIFPTFVYVAFWVGLAFASAFFGDIFRLFNPWLAVGRFVESFIGPLFRQPGPWRREYPMRLGRWPAALGLFAFGWIELAYTNKTEPAVLAKLALIYAALQLVGMLVYGVEIWSRHGDSFGVYFNTLSRLSPFERRDGVLYLRPPLGGAPVLPEVPGTVMLLAVMIGVTTFDGFTNGNLWQSWLPSLTGFFASLGAGPDAQYSWAASVGLVISVALVAGLFLFGAWGMRGVGENHGTLELARKFAHTLIPIAFVYIVAHYFTLLVYQGQTMYALISDPLGNGSDWFGTAGTQVDYSVVSGNLTWYIQVAALVVGHVAGLILAHDRALALYRDPRKATRSQYWMLIVMVTFTSLALWLLSDFLQ